MTAAYDAIADWYDETVRAGSLLHAAILPALFDLMGDLTGEAQGQSLCDLACGQGIVTRELARRGARVVGIDLSEKLLEKAVQQSAGLPENIVYRLGDAQHLPDIADATFDGVVCCMALMDIPDLNAIFQTVRRILRPGGWFVFAVTHPCFQTPPNGYFAEGFWRSDNPNGVRGKVGAIHRTLASYFNASAEAGFSVIRLAEPVIAGRGVPALLIARCERPI